MAMNPTVCSGTIDKVFIFDLLFLFSYSEPTSFHILQMLSNCWFVFMFFILFVILYIFLMLPTTSVTSWRTLAFNFFSLSNCTAALRVYLLKGILIFFSPNGLIVGGQKCSANFGIPWVNRRIQSVVFPWILLFSIPWFT